MKIELSDVICEKWSKSSGKISKANFETKQLVLKPPMQLRIIIQRSGYNYERDEYCKNKTEIALPAQYSMSFPAIESEVLYIIVSVKLNIGKDVDKGHYLCGVLYHNTGILWSFDDDTISQYPGYPMNLYDVFLIVKKERKLKNSVFE